MNYITLQQRNIITAVRGTTKPFSVHELFLGVINDNLVSYASGISSVESSTGVPSGNRPSEAERQAIADDFSSQTEEAIK